jgi:hypothetical protein
MAFSGVIKRMFTDEPARIRKKKMKNVSKLYGALIITL